MWQKEGGGETGSGGGLQAEASGATPVRTLDSVQRHGSRWRVETPVSSDRCSWDRPGSRGDREDEEPVLLTQEEVMVAELGRQQWGW